MKRKTWLLACCLLVGCVGMFAFLQFSPLQSARAEEETSIGGKIDSFRLPDYRGKLQSLDDFANSKLLVIAFLGTECPLVKSYGPRLAELSREYGPKGVQFIGVNSNLQDTITEIAAFANQARIDFPILKDAGNIVADAFGAERTPEVFVLDEERVVRYRGRIDDQYGTGASSGYARTELKRRDLAVALDELLDGHTVSQPVTTASGCLIGRVARVTPHGEINYAQHIAPILQEHCVTCHRPGEAGPFALTSYDEVIGWADMIREVVSERRMPPWFADPRYGKFANDCRLSDEEMSQIESWIECGCPQGNLEDLPAAKEFATGWQIGDPDGVYYMSDEPFKVPLKGLIDYQYYIVDPGFTEDKWVEAMECRPGNRAVVHHIGVTMHPRGDTDLPSGRGVIIGYTPGMNPMRFPKGVGMKIPKNTVFKFQMHYTANGNEEIDRSAVGFKFMDPAMVKQEASGLLCGTFVFKIPPGEANHEVVSHLKFSKDMLLLMMLPHMHVRGKSFRFEVEYPGGAKEVLLDVPRYDFNWQMWYELSQPKLLPKGTKMTCTAHYDNSADNPFNPDPTVPVTFGEQSWEEMMYGFMTVLDPNQKPPLTEQGDQDVTAKAE